MKRHAPRWNVQKRGKSRPWQLNVWKRHFVPLVVLVTFGAGFSSSAFATAPLNAQMMLLHHADRQKVVEVLEPADHDDSNVDAVIDHIMEHAGLARNFIQHPARIPNALATMDERGRRVIYYNPTFIREISSYGSPKWSQISVMLHEIGHHLLGHIFEYDQNSKTRELEADEFSGFLIYRMGATLQEAQLVASEYAQNWETPTHPARDQRLEAIARGWKKAQQITLHEREMDDARARRERAE
jgi:hypothetical protein